MPTEITKVLYDVSQAEKALKKLDKTVKKSGKTAKNSFTDGGAAVRRFGARLRPVNKTLAKTVRSFGKLGVSSGAIAGGFAIAGGAILATIANVVNLSSKLADIDARLNVINDTAERTLDLRNQASAIGDARDDRVFVEARRELELLETAQAFRENTINVAKQDADKLVAIRKSQFARIDAAFKSSIQLRQTAEQRLRSKLAEGTIVGSEFSTQTKGRQVGSLTDKAEQEARKGNISAAEALIEKAQGLSRELGNHVFFTKQIEQAQGAVFQALEKEVKTAKTKEGQLAEERKLLQGRIVDAEGFAKVLQKELDLITRQNRAFTAQQRIIQNSSELLEDIKKQEAGQRRVETGIGQIQEITGDIGGQAFTGQLRDQFGNAFTAVVKEFGTKLGSIGSGRESVDAILRSIGGAFETAFEDGVLTPSEAEKIHESAIGVSSALAVLEKDLASGELSGALKQSVERVISLFQGIENLGRGAEQFVAGGGGDQAITAGATQQSRRSFERVIERREIQQEINVNFEGGLIDAATIEQMTDIIRREVRKEVSKGAGANDD